MSLTKEEIVWFTESHLDVEYLYEDYDDFVVFAWIKFFKSHGLNPLLPQHIVFSADEDIANESMEYKVDWMPITALSTRSFEYKRVHIAIEEATEGSGFSIVERAHEFTPELGHGLIK